MEFTEHKINQLQKLSRFIGILSFAAFVILIVFGFWQLGKINRQLRDGKKNLAEQEARMKENDERIQAQNNLLKSVPPEFINLAFENNPEAAKALPRVYLHIGEEAQRELAVRLQKKLQAEGYIVPSIQNIKGIARVPAETELRFCEGKGVDSDIAEIKDLLAGDGVDLSIHSPLKTPGCVNVTNDRTYELWLKNNPPVQQ